MNIIIVDDDKTMIFVMKKILEKIQGINIANTFIHTRDVVDFIKESKIDMVFLDISMPEENGLELARRILDISPFINIVFITSHREYAVEAFDICAFDYIVKPVLQERLERTVKRALEKGLGLVEKNSVKENKISVYLFGGIDASSESLGTVKWSSAKSVELFVYLLLKEGRNISKNVIIEELFYEMPLKNAENYLKTSVYQIRKALEPHSSAPLLISSNGSYKLECNALYVDFIEFEKKLSNIHEIDSSNIAEALKIEKLFGGELLGDRVYYWSMSEREKYLNSYLNLAKKIGEYFFYNGDDMNQASYILKKLLKFDPINEKANYLLMEIFSAQNDKKSLMNHYEQYEKNVKKELGILPEVTMVNLYEKLIGNFNSHI